MTDTFLRGALLSFNAKPDNEHSAGIDYEADGVLVLRNGLIHDRLSAQAFTNQGGDLDQCEDLRGSIVIPGLIDTHIHYSQMAIVASYGSQLMEWLDRYAFPAELAFASNEHAQLQAETFLDELFAQGTTTALTFTTVHPGSTDALFTAAAKRNVRLIAGKVLMDRNAPDGLTDKDTGCEASAQLIERWHQQGRLAYAVTPRFAITCSHAQLQAAGELLNRYPGLYLHTHLSEQPDEVEATLSLFPEASDYVNVYERFGMVGERSVFAHGIHLSDSELQRLSNAGSTIAFCPTSNMFLGSGLLDLQRLVDHKVSMGVATDVGGGTSYSMLATLGDGYKVAQLSGQSWHPMQAIYAATAGNALALGLEDRIGSLAPGHEADIAVLKPAPQSILSRRLKPQHTITEQLFAHMFLGGNDAIERCYVAGNKVYQRPQPMGAL